MAHFPLLFRLFLAGAGSLLVFAPPLAPRAVAQDDWDDGGWGDDEEEEDDGGGWGDGGGGGGGWGEEEDEDEEQPPVTAGGLYTKRTYPVAELQRPLTLIEGMFEGRVGLDVDLSNETAFDNWRGVVEARYGLKDFWELRLAADFLMAGDAVLGPGGTNQARIVAGVERSIVFDLVDFRAQAEVPINPDAPEGVDSAAFDLAFGFPFRYRYKDKIGLIALEKLMTIHTDGRDPDLTPAVGVIAQLAPPFAILAEAEVIVPEFDFERDVVVPVTAAAQFSPSNRVDLGLEFTFANVNPPEGAGPLDFRTLLLYVQPRF